MHTESLGINFTTPSYFHREYKNDVVDKQQLDNNQELIRRITKTILPFISLYKPLNYPLSVGLGAYRSIVYLLQLKSSIQNDQKVNIPSQLIATATSIMALAATIIAPPLGMLITTIQDLIIEIRSLEDYLSANEYQKAAESCVNIINNALYLSLFFIGGIELTIASLAVQILQGIYHGNAEFRKGNYLEAAGHSLMAIIRCKQISNQVNLLQSRWKEKETHQKLKNDDLEKQKKAIDDLKTEIRALEKEMGSHDIQNHEETEIFRKRLEGFKTKIELLQKNLLDKQEIQRILITYDNNPDGMSAFHYAIKTGDAKAVNLFLESGANTNSRDGGFTALMRAVCYNQLEIARMLLDKGADVNATYKVPVPYGTNLQNDQLFNSLY